MTTSTHHVEQPLQSGPAGPYGRVILTVQSAHNLRDTAWIGKADPYVEVTLADATISTHHVRGAGESATFDESFAFNNVMPDDVIEFHVYDKNRVRPDSHMGEGSLQLRKLFDQGSLETRVPLSTRTGTKDAGELWVSLRSEGPATAAAGGGGGAGMAAGAGGAEKSGYERAPEGYETGAAAGQERGVSSQTGGATGATTTTAAGGVGVGDTAREGGQPVCSQEYFTKVEDRPVVKERVEHVREHRPYEKEFVVETRPTGEVHEAREGRTVEHLGTTEQVLSEAKPSSPCS